MRVRDDYLKYEGESGKVKRGTPVPTQGFNWLNRSKNFSVQWRKFDQEVGLLGN